VFSTPRAGDSSEKADLQDFAAEDFAAEGWLRRLTERRKLGTGLPDTGSI
jgi:hypothetical protein